MSLAVDVYSRKNTFCNAAKRPVYIIAARSWISNVEMEAEMTVVEVAASLHPPNQRHHGAAVSDSSTTHLKLLLLSSVPSVVSDVSGRICGPFAYCFASSEGEES